MVLVGALMMAGLAGRLMAQPQLQLESPAFRHNGPLPLAFTGYGDFKSPPLTWSGVPSGTKEFALIMDDPDVPLESFSVHWLLYDIPATVTRVPEKPKPSDPKANRASPIKGAMQGTNALKRVGYLPPRPFADSGAHHYTFTLYALDADLPLTEGMTKPQLLAAMKGHILAQASIVAVFERKEP
jgi:Raf kinase inhibitor-like YbhB/YbcL family protein